MENKGQAISIDTNSKNMYNDIFKSLKVICAGEQKAY